MTVKIEGKETQRKGKVIDEVTIFKFENNLPGNISEDIALTYCIQKSSSLMASRAYIHVNDLETTVPDLFVAEFSINGTTYRTNTEIENATSLAQNRLKISKKIIQQGKDAAIEEIAKEVRARFKANLKVVSLRS